MQEEELIPYIWQTRDSHLEVQLNTRTNDLAFSLQLDAAACPCASRVRSAELSAEWDVRTTSNEDTESSMQGPSRNAVRIN